MKCASCDVDVPPAFAKALIDNVCPACGKEIFKAAEFQELLKVKGILQDAGLDEKIVVSVAAVISNKYDITIKKPHVARHQSATVSAEDIDSAEGLSEEERMKLRALNAAQQERKEREASQIKEEWGLNHGELSASAMARKDGSQKKLIDPEMAALFSEMQSGDVELDAPPLELKGFGGLSSKNHERLARAEAMKNDPARFKIMRAE